MCLYNMAEEYNKENIKRRWDCFTVKKLNELEKKEFVNYCTDTLIGNATYDAIFLDDDIERKDSPVQMLKDWKCRLKEGGWIFLTISNIANHQVVKRLLHGCTMRKLSCRYTLRDLQDIVAEAGFSYSKYVTIRDNLKSNALLDYLTEKKLLSREHTLFDHWYCMMISCDDPAVYQYQLPYPLSARRELGYLLRRIENDIEVPSNIVDVLRLCKEYNITSEDLYYAVEHMTNNSDIVLHKLTSFSD